MKEFKFLDYHTEYSCTGDLSYETDNGACFGYVFDGIRDNYNVEYCIILYKGLDYIKDTHDSNACLLDLHSLKNHLRKLRFFYPISYSIKETEHNESEVFKVSLKLKDVPAIFHKFALTWIRYAYEYPYNVWLIDAYKLHNYYRYDSIFNLFHIIGICGNIDRDIHQIVEDRPYKKINNTDLRNIINGGSDRLQRMFKYSDNVERYEIPNTIGEYSRKDYEYWKEGFEERKPVYMKMYRLISKL